METAASPRTLTDHKVNGLNEALEITVLDEPGSGGANHRYELRLLPPGRPVIYCAHLNFQNGPIATPADFNGLTNEALLAVLIDRMRGFQGLLPNPYLGSDSPTMMAAYESQKGKFACRENAIALTHLEEALMWLQKRTLDRMRRGVEGSNKP